MGHARSAGQRRDRRAERGLPARGGPEPALWQPQLAALADYHCLAPDLPEHGESRAVGPFTLPSAADAVAALIRPRAPTGRAHVVGLSLGGAVALTLLHLVPEVVQSVLVSGVAAPLPRPVRGLARTAAGAVAVVPRGVLATTATLPVRLPWGPYAVPASDRAALCRDLRHSFTPSFVHHVAVALTELELPRVASAPVLVLVGGQELWGSRAAARRVVASIQGARGAHVAHGRLSRLGPVFKVTTRAGSPRG